VRVFAKVVIGERGNLDAPFSQWRYVQSHNAETIEEIFSEAPLADESIQVGVCGDDHANIHAVGLRLADAVNFAGIQEAQ
jgi:hypothetical protein